MIGLLSKWSSKFLKPIRPGNYEADLFYGTPRSATCAAQLAVAKSAAFGARGPRRKPQAR